MWTNLFRNYISCLNLTVVLAKLLGNDGALDPNQIPIEGLEDAHETPTAAAILDELCTNVFDRYKAPRIDTRFGKYKSLRQTR